LRISIFFLFRFFGLSFSFGSVVFVVGRAVVVVVAVVVVLIVSYFRRGRVPAYGVAVPVVRLEAKVGLTV